MDAEGLEDTGGEAMDGRNKWWSSIKKITAKCVQLIYFKYIVQEMDNKIRITEFTTCLDFICNVFKGMP